jgi:hypothetical protein
MNSLNKFAVGTVRNNPCTAVLQDLINYLVHEAPGSMRHDGAEWFLLESERAFFFACAESGIDADRLRDYLAHEMAV